MAYQFRVAGEVLAGLIGTSPRQQWRLHDCFARIAADPFAEPDLKLHRGEDAVLVRVFGDTLVHYIVEHAKRTVTIVEFEIVREPSR